MSAGEEGKANELVIIRRRAGGEDGAHKGGVWKIAYADFMTAMMAFFLVMWLINSTDKKTLTQVATYFNPLRLTDKRPSPKGLHEAEGGEASEASSAKAAKAIKAKDSVAKGATKRDDSEFGEVRPKGQQFQDGRETRNQGRSGTGGETEQMVHQPTGRAHRDPFDPVLRSEIAPSDPASGRIERPQRPVTAMPSAEGGRDPTAAPARLPAQEAAKELPAQEVVSKEALAKEMAGKEAAIRETLLKEAAAKDAAAKEAAAKEAAAREAADRADAARLEEDLRKAVAESLPGTIPHIDVMVTPEGVLISLTDDYEFGMFASASAEPRPAMVVVMDKVARVVLPRQETLVVRGHTDRRPYRSAAYDNWRLSAARAHVAYTMLARGGVEERRFERIEGHADRNPRIPHDPEAAQNRRIEILLRKQTP